jgi:glycosyltransferase involved in cell wall biosynthesis
MRIAMVLDKPFPPDPRVAAEARCLLAAGHSVHLICLQEAGQLPHEVMAGLSVHRFSMGRSFQKRAGALCLTLPLYDLWFRRHLAPLLATQGIEALHVHDLRLAREGVWAHQRFGIPWVLDLHENFPASLRDYAHARTLLGRLLIWPSAWERFERKMAQRAHRVILVTPQAAADLTRRADIVPEKICVLPNVADRPYVERTPVPPPAEGLRLVYFGDTGQRRGTDLCVRAVAALKDRVPGLELIMAGTSSYQGQLTRLAADLGVGDCVQLLGWRPPEELPGLIESCHAGLAPFRRSPHHDTTFANKLFQCMALGRPIIASDCPAQKAVIEAEQCGLVFTSGSVGDLTDCIMTLHEDRARAVAMGEGGRRAVRERYNWDVTGQELVGLYDRLMSG